MHLIVHGGAGDDPDEPDRRQAVLDEAVAAGEAESNPVAAAVAAVGVLESNPRFNAGVGGAVQSDGVVRTDAGLMTDDRRIGAACSMAGVEHAADVARVVLAETPHVFVSGDHAVSLAEEFGIECEIDLTTPKTRKRWADADPPAAPRAHLDWVREKYGGSDTVGAVAVDGDARVASLTSTGGRWAALAGRVGDVPQVGSGFFATSAGGASATGAGEDIVRTTLTREAVRNLDDGLDPQDAADRALSEFEAVTGSTAGLIVLDSAGRAGSAYNSAAMQTSSTER